MRFAVLMGLGERMRAGWLALIQKRLNPRTLRLAREGRGEFSIVRHIGRTSGKTFETPIIARPVEGGLIAELTYGERVNWYRNLVAAGHGEVERGGRVWHVTGIQQIPTGEGLAAFAAPQRLVLRILRRRHFLKLVTSD